MLRNLTITRKLILSFILVGVFPVFIMGLLAYLNASQSLSQDAEQRLDAITTQKKIQLENLLKITKANIKAISKTQDVKRALSALVKYHQELGLHAEDDYDVTASSRRLSRSYASIHSEVTKLVQTYLEEYGYRDIYLICVPHGHIMYTYLQGADLGSNLVTGPYQHSALAALWQRVKAGEDFVLTDTQYDDLMENEPVLYTGSPVRDEKGQLIGIIAVKIDQTSIDEIMQEATGMGRTGDSYLVGRDMYMRSNSRLMSEQTTLHQQVATMGVETCFAEKREFDGIYPNHNTLEQAELMGRSFSRRLGGIEVIGMVTYLPDFDWVLVAEMDVAEALAPVKRLRSSMILLSLLIAAVVAILGYLLSRTIVTPLKRVGDMIRDIAQGEGNLTARLDIDSHDEIGEIAHWFDAFTEKLGSIIASVQNASQSLAATTNKIATAAEEMVLGAEHQQNQLSEVSDSMEEMSAMILQTNRNAESTLQSSDMANQASKRGSTTVQMTIHGIEGISKIVHHANLQISSLKDRSEEIGEVIQVIDEIADQTNLLALNANIEAARAGEAGRGFAVVADEVRKLAERTVQATADIGSKINLVQEDVNATVEAMNEIAEQSGKGQREAAEAGEALVQIGESIGNVNAAINQIASAAMDQSSGVEQISRNVENVSTVSKQSAAGANELAAATDELNNQVKELDALMSQFKI